MITGSSKQANAFGVRVHQMGGNVFDVAVGVGLVMTVTNPFNASLGGGGFALIHNKGKVRALDFREMAPQSTSPDFYLNKGAEASTKGGTAIGVPGYIAGLYEIHKAYGKLPWNRLFTRAIALANNGFRVSGDWVKRTTLNKDRFNQSGRKYFFKNTRAYKPGDIMRQPQLAKALKIIQQHNINGFYKGPVAKDIIASVKKAGGVISEGDLKKYRVRWLDPIETNFYGYKIYLMPPPSSGGVIIKTALSLIESLKLKELRPLSIDELHYLAEIQSRSFRGRALLGDPRFHKNPLSMLFSSSYLSELTNSIRASKATTIKPLTDNEPKKESPQTTHFTVMDKRGNAVALTVTLNGAYGSGVVSNKYGITLNNQMDDFTTKPGKPNMFGLIQGKGNMIQAGKRPLSSMTPTFVKKGRKLVMALGAPGGPRIISGILQVLYRTLGNKFDIDFAIQYPRIHHQFLPNTLFYDQNRFSLEIVEVLKAKGHKMQSTPWNSRVNGIQLNDQNWLEGAFDARGEGSVEGL